MIDSSIPLSVRTPEISDPLNAYAKIAGLRNMLQQQALHAEQLKAAQLNNQKNELTVKDQALLREAVMENPTDPDKAHARYLEKGGGPDVGMAFQQHVSGLKKTIAEIKKDELPVVESNHKRIADIGGEAISMKPEVYTANYPNIVQRISEVDPEFAKKLPAEPIPQDRIREFMLGVPLEDALIKRQKAQYEAEDEARKKAIEKSRLEREPSVLAEAKIKAYVGGLGLAGQTVDAIGDQASWDSWRSSLPGNIAAMVPPMFSPASKDAVKRMSLTAEQQASEDDKKLVREQTKAHQANLERAAAAGKLVPFSSEVEAQKKRLQPAPNQITIPGLGGPGGGPAAGGGLTGNDYIEALEAAAPGTAAQVRAISEGRTALPSISSRGSGALIRDAVFKYDPTFTEQRAQVRKAFTTGPDGKNIGALNTAIVHLGRLGDVAEALNNGTFTPKNELWNYVKDKFGSASTTNFDLLKDAVAGEMATSLKGNATDQEIAHLQSSIRRSNSPQQMRGVVTEGMSILNDKANTYDERFHRENKDDTWSPILPSAKKQLQRYNFQAPSGGGGPKVGTIQDGYRFKGGNPGDPNNWEKVKP